MELLTHRKAKSDIKMAGYIYPKKKVSNQLN
jgi:hypothetical protein